MNYGLPSTYRLTPKQREASATFNDAWDDVGPGNCDGNPMVWTDYGNHQAPTGRMLKIMCGGCPVFRECDNLAKALKPTHGVWAGKSYGIQGKHKGGYDDD